MPPVAVDAGRDAGDDGRDPCNSDKKHHQREGVHALPLHRGDLMKASDLTSPKVLRIVLAVVAVAIVLVSALVPGAAKYTAYLWR